MHAGVYALSSIVKFLSVLLFFTNNNQLCYHPSGAYVCTVLFELVSSSLAKLIPCFIQV